MAVVTLKVEIIELLCLVPIAAGAIWMLLRQRRWGLLKILWIPIVLVAWLIWDIISKLLHR